MQSWLFSKQWNRCYCWHKQQFYLFTSIRCQKPIADGIRFTKVWRADTSVLHNLVYQDLTILNHPLNYFINIYWLDSSSFWEWRMEMRIFCKMKSRHFKGYQQCRFFSRQRFCLHTYSLWDWRVKNVKSAHEYTRNHLLPRAGTQRIIYDPRHIHAPRVEKPISTSPNCQSDEKLNSAGTFLEKIINLNSRLVVFSVTLIRRTSKLQIHRTTSRPSILAADGHISSWTNKIPGLSNRIEIESYFVIESKFFDPIEFNRIKIESNHFFDFRYDSIWFDMDRNLNNKTCVMSLMWQLIFLKSLQNRNH